MVYYWISFCVGPCSGEKGTLHSSSSNINLSVYSSGIILFFVGVSLRVGSCSDTEVILYSEFDNMFLLSQKEFQ